MHTSYETLIHEHRGAFERLARKLANNNRDDAEDLLQESLLDAYRSFDRFRPGSQFFNWFARIMTNNQLDRVRRNRQHVLSLDGAGPDEEWAAIEIPDHRANPEQLLVEDEFEAPLKRALDRLEPNQRITVQLCDLEGKTYEEAAAMTQVPIGTIRSRLHRAHKSLERSIPQPLPKPVVPTRVSIRPQAGVTVRCSRAVAGVMKDDSRLATERLELTADALKDTRVLVLSREDEARLTLDEVAAITSRVRFDGMGLVVLHGGESALLKSILGPTFGWTAEKNAPTTTGMVEIRAPRHPIAEGVGEFRLPRPINSGAFTGPTPDQVVLAAKDVNGTAAWQGMAWNVGKGRVFCFVPGCEIPDAGSPVAQVVRNAAYWCAGQQ